ncbi:hypothetical protein [Ancylobacter mangrovi]|uniref:hypothetical protein n=1 Tax=Ancylobacter mangrovi TaxID=2972472 RepID=UPI0021635726|nr:hypothetical protein [Ancylobacter mangrovi]MCS0503550.1 hypothetical protein [Ancylobacter mangrovi]
MQQNAIYLHFPDRAAALAMGAALAGGERVERLQPEGVYVGTYWRMDDIGTLYRPTGAVDGEGAPLYEALAGYYVNMVWCGPVETLPDAIDAFRIYPDTPFAVQAGRAS